MDTFETYQGGIARSRAWDLDPAQQVSLFDELWPDPSMSASTVDTEEGEGRVTGQRRSKTPVRSSYTAKR
jgi:hypothetical protein